MPDNIDSLMSGVQGVDVVSILRLGLPGLIFLLMAMSFLLIKNEQKNKTSNPERLRTIRMFVFTNIFLTVVTILAPVAEKLIKKEAEHTLASFTVEAVKGNSGDNINVGICTNSPYKSRYMLLKDPDPRIGPVQVLSKGILPCTENREELRLSDTVATQLGWDNKTKGTLVVDVAADGFKFDL